MTIEEMKQKKTELGLTNEMISQAADIPLSTVQKVLGKVTKAPRKATLEAIEAVLYAEEQRRKVPKVSLPDASEISYSHQPAQTGRMVCEEPVKYGLPDGNRADTSVCRLADSAGRYVPGRETADIVRESVGEYNRESSARDLSGDSDIPEDTKPGEVKKKNGEYTLEDYYALPDERRVELIDGVFYDMAAPAVIHQKILGDLFILFRECVDAHEGGCEVYLSPCDVRLDRDNRTMVQPDLLLMCHEYDIGAKAFDGAPDLTLEILSPSTRSKDMLLKTYKYANAGVREYWIVDPENEEVLVYDLEHGKFAPDRYDFDASIPIHISGGECSIDFSRINRALKKLRKK